MVPSHVAHEWHKWQEFLFFYIVSHSKWRKGHLMQDKIYVDTNVPLVPSCLNHKVAH